MKTKKHNLLTTVFVCLVISIFAVGVGAELSHAQKPAQLPATVGIGTHSVGGAYHASGSGIAALISEKTKIRAVVQPFGGPSAWMPLMQSGELELGLLSGFDAGACYAGKLGYDKPNTNFRIVLCGNIVPSSTFTVLTRSGIKKITDLRKKRVGSQYGGNKMLHNLAEAMLKSVRMTWKDVVPVGVPDFKSSIRMLRERRIDCGTSGSPTTPAARELHNALKVNVLAFGDVQPKDIAKASNMQGILDEFVPGCFPTVVKSGVGVLEKDTILISYPIYLAASATFSEDAVYIILKTIWENYSALHPVHPWLRGWKSDTMAAANQPAPYHNGAIKFYKEKGVWTKAMGTKQKQLLR